MPRAGQSTKIRNFPFHMLILSRARLVSHLLHPVLLVDNFLITWVHCFRVRMYFHRVLFTCVPYYAYTYYTGLLKEQTLHTFHAGWLKALGDLAHYHMAVAAMVTGTQGPGPEQLTTTAVSTVLSRSPNPSLSPSSVLGSTFKHVSKIKLGIGKAHRMQQRLASSPSVGLAAAEACFDVKPEKE